MKSIFNNFGTLSALAVGLLGGALFCQQAQAVPITVYEEIKDLRTGGTSTNPSDVQLQRNRLNPDGTITTVTDDRASGVLGYVEANNIPAHKILSERRTASATVLVLTVSLLSRSSIELTGLAVSVVLLAGHWKYGVKR